MANRRLISPACHAGLSLASLRLPSWATLDPYLCRPGKTSVKRNQGVNLLCREGNSQPWHWMKEKKKVMADESYLHDTFLWPKAKLNIFIGLIFQWQKKAQEKNRGQRKMRLTKNGFLGSCLGNRKTGRTQKNHSSWFLLLRPINIGQSYSPSRNRPSI